VCVVYWHYSITIIPLYLVNHITLTVLKLYFHRENIPHAFGHFNYLINRISKRAITTVPYTPQERVTYALVKTIVFSNMRIHFPVVRVFFPPNIIIKRYLYFLVYCTINEAGRLA